MRFDSLFFPVMLTQCCHPLSPSTITDASDSSRYTSALSFLSGHSKRKSPRFWTRAVQCSVITAGVLIYFISFVAVEALLSDVCSLE